MKSLRFFLSCTAVFLLITLAIPSFAATKVNGNNKAKNTKLEGLKKISDDKLFKDTNKINAFCSNFLTDITANNVDKAFKNLNAISILPEKEMNYLKKQISTQLVRVKARYGKPIAHEFVKKEQLAPSILKFTYLLKCEKHFIIWTFYFYKPKNKWLFNQIQFSDQVKTL